MHTRSGKIAECGSSAHKRPRRRHERHPSGERHANKSKHCMYPHLELVRYLVIELIVRERMAGRATTKTVGTGVSLKTVTTVLWAWLARRGVQLARSYATSGRGPPTRAWLRFNERRTRRGRGRVSRDTKMTLAARFTTSSKDLLMSPATRI